MRAHSIYRLLVLCCIYIYRFWFLFVFVYFFVLLKSDLVSSDFRLVKIYAMELFDTKCAHTKQLLAVKWNRESRETDFWCNNRIDGQEATEQFFGMKFLVNDCSFFSWLAVVGWVVFVVDVGWSTALCCLRCFVWSFEYHFEKIYCIWSVVGITPLIYTICSVDDDDDADDDDDSLARSLIHTIIGHKTVNQRANNNT